MLTDLSIVVAYRRADPHRERIFLWTMRRWAALIPEAELIVGEMASDTGPFCLAEARNNGVRQSTRQNVLLADADAIGFREAVDSGLSLLECGGVARVFPYGNYYHLDGGTTAALLSSAPDADPRSVTRLQHDDGYPNSTSGLVLIGRDTFWQAGGFDERMKGWGPEDQAFDEAVTTLCGPSARIMTSDLWHLNHPVAPGSTTTNPHYAASCVLWDEYKAASGDVDAMRMLVRGARR
jgi:hypothetical protein